MQKDNSKLKITNLRPHIRLYQTIVPCRWCCDGETFWDWGSGVLIWIDVCIWSCWTMEDPPSAGLIPGLLRQGTPIGVGSSGGVTYNKKFRFFYWNFATIFLFTSRPMLPLRENLIGLEWLLACMRVVKWLIPISSREDFRRPVLVPRFGKPCRRELERLKRMSFSIYKEKLEITKNSIKKFTLSELLRPRCWPVWFGESGSESEFDFVVTKGGARGLG